MDYIILGLVLLFFAGVGFAIYKGVRLGNRVHKSLEDYINS